MMKTKMLFAILWTLSVAGHTQTSNFTVKGRVGQLNAPDKIYLTYQNDGKTITDSMTLKKGEFEFKGIINKAKRASLIIRRAGNASRHERMPLYLDKGTILVTSVDSIQNATITGTKITDDFATYFNIIKQSDQFKSNLLKKFVEENPSSYISLNALSSLSYTADLQEFSVLETTFKHLSPDIQNSEEGQNFLRELSAQKKVAVGGIAPDFMQPDTSGKQLN